MVYFRCLNPLTMASHLKASLMLSWWGNIFCFTIHPLTLYFWFYCVFWWVWFFDHDRLYVCVFEMKWRWHPGFVRRVQSSEVEEQEPTDFCLHINFPGGKPAICSNFTARLKHWLQLKDLCLNLQNVVHTFAKLRVNIGDFKVTSKLFCTLWLSNVLVIESFWLILKNLNF